MTDTSGFSLWFLEIVKAKKYVLSCPESLAYVDTNMELPTQKEEWLDIVKDQQVKSSSLWALLNKAEL